MLRQVSNAQYLEAIRMAEKFILHVEVLFATIDDIETYFLRLNLKGAQRGIASRPITCSCHENKGCLTSEKLAYFVGRPSISSRYFRGRKTTTNDVQG